MKCKKCHPAMNHRLIQSGLADPKSNICTVCGTYHDSSGKLYDTDAKPQSTELKCGRCGSTNVIKYRISRMYICKNCGYANKYTPEQRPKMGVFIKPSLN